MPASKRRDRRKRKHVQENADSDSVGSAPVKKVRWDRKEDEGDAEESETGDDDNDDDAQLCIAVTCAGDKLGGAFFHPERRTIYLVEDTTESSQFDLARLLFEQIKPDLVLAPSRADEDFISFSREYMEETGGTFQVRPHREFTPDKGRDKMLSLAIFVDAIHSSASTHTDSTTEPGSRSGNAYSFMQQRRRTTGDPSIQRHYALIRLSNYSSTETPLCLSAVGALLEYLSRIKAPGDLENEGIAGLDVQNIELLALDQAMQLNADALTSLQIFEDESHACKNRAFTHEVILVNIMTAIHSTKSKEGLSLFGILDFTKTNFGRSLLRQWCLRPSLSIPEIEGRHDAVDNFIRGENIPTAEAMHTQLKGLKNAPRAFARITAGKGTVAEWEGLVRFAYHASILMETVGDLADAQGVPIIEKLRSAVDVARLKDMGSAINDIIDWESSENERRTCVRPHKDDILDQQKQIYHGLDNLLSKVALEVKKDVPPGWATSLNVLYFPQLGYLICVPLKEEWTDQAAFEMIEGWIYQFSSDVSAYFKNSHMHDLDEHIGDLHTNIADREIEIIQRLEQKIVHFENDVLSTCEACAELDCLLSFAMVSRLYSYRRPCMVADNVLHIKNGRHPLVEQLADIFVPNDVWLIGGRGQAFSEEERGGSASQATSEAGDSQRMSENGAFSIAICTGANACGKGSEYVQRHVRHLMRMREQSVYLKQNALIPFMAQIGCFVPAELATLGIIDKIFTRLQARESVSKIQSTFMIDLSQVSLALRNATARSLILLDEFGNGTTPADGAGLFYGVIRHLLGLKNDAHGSSRTPKVIAATHFHEIFANGLLGSRLPIDYMHMEAMLSKASGQLVDLNDATADITGSEDGAEQIEIHYLYRVAKGLSLNSHATKCALMYGIPRAIVGRAERVSELMACHELGQLLDEDLTEVEKTELEEAETVCRTFVAWDLDKDVTSVKDRLAKVLDIDS